MKENLMKHSCCFSGHRYLPAEQLEEIRKNLKNSVVTLIKQGVSVFYAGGADGFDTEAMLTVNELKQKYPHIKLIVVLPYRRNIKIPYDECICLSETLRKGCFHIRNRYLVEHSQYCICYLTENTGGTFYTVKYAEHKGLNVINIACLDK